MRSQELQVSPEDNWEHVEKFNTVGQTQLLNEDESDLSNVELPYVLEDRVIMSPGVWNGHRYTEREIRRAYRNTDWNDDEVKSLFLDHRDKEAGTWLGTVENVSIDNEGFVRGDLHIADEEVARKLKAGANFGISPKVFGDVKKRGGEEHMTNFSVHNNSVVMNPAIKTAFVNNDDGGKIEYVDVVSVQELNEDGEVVEHQEITPQEFWEFIASHMDGANPQDIAAVMDSWEFNGMDEREIATLYGNLVDARPGEIMDAVESSENSAELSSDNPESNREVQTMAKHPRSHGLPVDGESDSEETPDGQEYSPVPDEHFYPLSANEVRSLMAEDGFSKFADNYLDEHEDASIGEVANAFKQKKYDAEINELRDEIAALKEQLQTQEKTQVENEEEEGEGAEEDDGEDVSEMSEFKEELKVEIAQELGLVESDEEDEAGSPVTQKTGGTSASDDEEGTQQELSEEDLHELDKGMLEHMQDAGGHTSLSEQPTA